MGYPTTAALVDGSDIPALTDLDSDQQDALRASGIAAVEGFCRQSFQTAQEDTITLDGNDLQTLYLPRRLQEFSVVTFNDTDVEADAFALNMSHNRLSMRELGSWGTWADKAMADFDGAPRTEFPIGNSNIAITGVWGWTDAEYDAELGAVTVALRWDMEDQARAEASKLTQLVQTARSQGLATISQGGLSADLSRRAPTISPRVKRVLAGRTPSGEKLRWPRAGGVVV
jgi:hypothetical protein